MLYQCGMENVKIFLSKWKLIHLFNVFEEQNIDDPLLIKHLTNDQIRLLAPNIGDQIKLQQGIKSLSSDQVEDQNDEPPEKKQRVELHDESYDTTLTDNIPIIFLENNFEALARPSTSNAVEAIYDTISQTSDTVTVTDTSTASSCTVYERKSDIQMSALNNFDLEKFLKNDILGEALLVKGTKLNAFNNGDRDRLCELLIKHLLNEHKKLSTLIKQIWKFTIKLLLFGDQEN
ncbi:uncharacterized protein LOC116183035 [Photinus pyralis]|uniref:uncharacterized protein LOC116183035 n=1 Tax=Photinus pyralis TaxID=7054 RepID=UPI001267297A|nr:uncharacterized protein LOC116183035 [Photinus pyralis]